MKLKVVIQSNNEDDGYVASCPAFPGCHSQEETKEEALANNREAIEGDLVTRNTRLGILESTDSGSTSRSDGITKWKAPIGL